MSLSGVCVTETPLRTFQSGVVFNARHSAHVEAASCDADATPHEAEWRRVKLTPLCADRSGVR